MNSETPKSNQATGQLTNTPSANVESSSPITYNEAPLLSLPPGQSVLAPSKPLREMSDAELSAWHQKLRDHKNFQTMQAHLALVGAPTGGKTKTKAKVVVDANDFV